MQNDLNLKKDKIVYTWRLRFHGNQSLSLSRHDTPYARTRGPALYSTFIEVAMSSKRQKTLHSFLRQSQAA